MRTTVRLDDDLYRRVKAHAVEHGRTVSAVIEDAVRAALASRPRKAAHIPKLPVFGGSGVLAGVELASNAALRERMDEDVPLDAVR